MKIIFFKIVQKMKKKVVLCYERVGYEMFAEDYSDYPGIGYYGVPLSGWMAELAEVILGKN